jgi:site-specific recombinase XerD
MGAAPTLADLAEIWRFDLESRGRSPRTIRSYLETSDQFIAWSEDNNVDTTAIEIHPAHIRGYVAWVVQTRSTSTARLRFRSLQQLFRFLVEEGNLPESPMARLRAPAADEKVVPVIPDEDLRKLIRTTRGDSFNDRRDRALILFLLDTGARIGEALSIRTDDVQLKGNAAVLVTGKGSRERWLPIGGEVGKAIGQYEIIRRGHEHADREEFWISDRGRLTDSGVRQMLERRCERAGVPRVTPHQFRHSFAHAFLADGGNETDLMRLAGWSSRQMVSRYAASAGAERARDAHREHSPVRRLLR